MKNFFTMVVLLIFLIVSSSIAQLHWTKDASNPVMSGGASGAWNRHVFMPNILFNSDSSRFEMWHGTSSGPPTWYPYKMGFAVSTDGITWTKRDSFLFEPDSGEITLEEPTVIRENGQYKMWYNIRIDTTAYIRYATSTDGINWEKYPDPVLTAGSETWEQAAVGYCSVQSVQAGGYEMWYTGSDGQNWSIGHATSNNGVIWQRDTVNNPVLSPGTLGQWDSRYIWAPEVLYINGLYHMWYIGSINFNNRYIGYATSIDGIHWVKYDDPNSTSVLYASSDPVLIPGPSVWDYSLIELGSVMIMDSTLHMWYSGSGNPVTTRTWKIGHATAPLDYPVTIHVPGHFPTIQQAIDFASEGSIVLVNEGTYYENINFRGKAITVASRFLIDGDSSHINNTIIDGSQPSDPDSASVVSFVSGEDTTSILCGFTIRGGTGTNYLSPTGDIWRAGGGVYSINGLGASIINNHITENQVSGDQSAGGGVAIGAVSGVPAFLILEGNHILNNSVSADLGNGRGGGVFILGEMNVRVVGNVFERDTVISTAYAVGGAIDIWAGGTLADGVIQNNTFRENIAEALAANNGLGGALSMYSTGPITVSENIFEGNIAKSRNAWGEGGAILLDDTDVPDHGEKHILANWFIGNMAESQFGTARGGAIDIVRTTAAIDRNYFSDNTADAPTSRGGAIGLGRSAFKIENNIVCNNSAPLGAGAYVYLPPHYGTGQVIINNTFAYNSATTGGGSIASSGSSPIIINSILWSDSTSAGAEVDGSASIYYSDVKGGYSGTGNFDAYPLFVIGDTLFNLSDSSLCIGAGIDSILGHVAPPFDYDGDARPTPADSMPDIGAQENPLANPIDGIFVIDSAIPNKYSLKQNYPNPFNPSTTIEFSIPKTEQMTLKIYNLLGQEVITLVSNKLTPGEYKYTWDASQLASGVYIYKLEAGNFSSTKKLILLK